MTENDIILGIDLGTTNSAAAVMEDGSPRLIQIDGEDTMPSCVGLSETGEILVGRAALNQLAAAPDRTAVSVKRIMGSDIPVKLGDRQYRPEEISGFILKRLKDEAERDLGQPVTKAVVTVPAYFDEKQRKATQDAVRLAGLDPVRILNEPTAAALAYNVDQNEGQTILVYDLGGGTFDVSLVICEKGLVEVKASHGDTHLGGDDFDEVLSKKVSDLAGKKLKLDWNDPLVSRRLRVACEQAKCSLSDHAFASIREEYFDGEKHLDEEISRRDFEDLIAPLLDKTWSSLNTALEDGGVKTQDIDKILLVGGSTRIPMVHESIEDRVGMTPSAEVNPDLIVAMGAAIQGGIITGQDTHSILVDICTHTYSTAALVGGSFLRHCVPIIKRGTALPVTRSDAFQTVVDNQELVQIDVYQGESVHPVDNLQIGEFNVEGLSEVPAGNCIIAQFALDLNGMLEVTATEKRTGLAKAVTIDTKNIDASLDLAEAKKRMAEALGEAAIDIEVETEPEQVKLFRSLQKRAKKLLKNDLEEEDRVELEELLASGTSAIQAQEMDRLRLLSDKLEDIIFYLED